MKKKRRRLRPPGKEERDLPGPLELFCLSSLLSRGPEVRRFGSIGTTYSTLLTLVRLLAKACPR